jgi:hypothetical protein
MSNGFQFFEGSASINSTTPQVTVRKSGQVVLTQAAVELLGEGVEQVQVGYNAKTGAVGIRPATDGGRGALRLRKQPNGRSKLIDAKRFFAHDRAGSCRSRSVLSRGSRWPPAAAISSAGFAASQSCTSARSGG